MEEAEEKRKGLQSGLGHVFGLFTSYPNVVSGLQLHYIHGYRGFDSRNNALYTARGTVVYHAAAAGIVLHPDSNEQVGVRVG